MGAGGAAVGAVGLNEAQEVLLAFSLKEAAYKAMDPLLGRSVGWHEVEVRPRADGSCEATFLGPPPPLAAEAIELRAEWRRVGSWIVSAVDARRGGL